MPSRAQPLPTAGEARAHGQARLPGQRDQRLQHRRDLAVRVVVAVEVRGIALHDLAEPRELGARLGQDLGAGSRRRGRRAWRAAGPASSTRLGTRSGGSAGGAAGERDVQADPRGPGCCRASAATSAAGGVVHHQGRAGHDPRAGGPSTTPRLMPAVRPKSSAFTIRRLLAVMSASRSRARATAPARRLHGQQRGPGARAGSRLRVERVRRARDSALNTPPASTTG